jgi:leucyl aminopeptidase
VLTIVSSSEIEKKLVEMLVIPVCKDADIHPSDFMPELMHQTRSLKEFNGADNEDIVFYAPSGVKAAQVMIIGLGKKDTLDGEILRKACGRAIKKCIQKEITEALFVVPFEKFPHLEPDIIFEAMVEGVLLGNYQFDRFKNPKHPSLLKTVFAVPKASVPHARLLAQKIKIICEGTLLAREWVITPSNQKRPEQFARSLVKVAEKENLKTEIMDQSALKKKNFGALLAVAAGSNAEARMVVLEHDPGNATQTLALVGKGVTFDSGGINLKSQGSIEDMKMDMAGAAAVAATMITAARLKLPVRLIGVLPLVENMPSGSATRPGDIVKSFSGKTIEINNTDAEGRLILADAMSYVIQTYKPDAVVDLATLTGACVVALGERIAGVFSPDDGMAETLIASGRKTFERCWKMPLPEDYKELLKSEFADICNITGLKWGGAITAALFLSEFTENTRWMHIDIAGPAYVKKETAYCGVGGTGFGVRLLCDWLEKMAKTE